MFGWVHGSFDSYDSFKIKPQRGCRFRFLAISLRRCGQFSLFFSGGIQVSTVGIRLGLPGLPWLPWICHSASWWLVNPNPFETYAMSFFGKINSPLLDRRGENKTWNWNHWAFLLDQSPNSSWTFVLFCSTTTKNIGKIFINHRFWIHEQWKYPGWLGFIGDYTTQWCGDYIKSLQVSLLNSQDSMESSLGSPPFL